QHVIIEHAETSALRREPEALLTRTQCLLDIRGVGERPDEADDASLEIVLRRRLSEEPADTAVRKRAAELAGPGLPGGDCRPNLPPDRLAVVGVEALVPSRLERGRREARQVGEALADVETAVLEVRSEDTHGHHAGERREFERFSHVSG